MVEVSTYFLCRFDEVIRTDVSDIIFKHATDTPEFIQTQSCMITIFHSEASLDEIHSELKELLFPTQITYFFIDISDIDNIAMNWPKDIYDKFAKYIGVSNNPKPKSYTSMSITELEKVLNHCLDTENFEKANIIYQLLQNKRLGH